MNSLIKSFETDSIKCPHRFECQGCQTWDLDYLTQLEHKKNDLKKKLNNTIVAIQVKTSGSGHQRTRFDFTIENQKMGLYGANRELINLSTCFQLDPDLNTAFINLQNTVWPFNKGSVRLRISPDKMLGLWLDLANIDIKNMLIEKTFLMKISQKFFIEIGQKRKTLDLNSFDQPQLKLAEPKPQTWFKTQTHNLFSFVSSFTQPTWLSADLITENILNWISEIDIQNEIIEYGCGIGQYTHPLLENKYTVNVFETDELALDCLQLNCADFLTTLRINPDLKKSKIDLAIVNPPRSGLKDFVTTIMLHQPKNIIYISCYPESLAIDLNTLQTQYKLLKAEVIDQFPQTKHYEAMILLQRID